MFLVFVFEYPVKSALLSLALEKSNNVVGGGGGGGWNVCVGFCD
jgi:hypothetical protein